ncbi:MAG: amidohydrolase family protein [Pirellula sp.]
MMCNLRNRIAPATQSPKTFAASLLLVAAWTLNASVCAEDWLLENATVHTVGKSGTIEQASIHVSDGKIKAIGSDLAVPISIRKVDGKGKHVIPGMVGLFYPVATGGDQSAGETRTITVGGRTFTVGGGSPAVSTSFTVVSENIGLDSLDWQLPTRTGVTTMQLIAPGYCQSAVVKPGSDRYSSQWVEAKSQLVVTLTNSPQSLDLLRNNLKDSTSSAGGTASGPSRSAPPFPPRTGGSGRGPRGSSGGPPGTAPSTQPPAAEASTKPPAAELTPEQKLWKQVRDGERSLWLNVNNSATILYALQILKEYPKAKVVWIANGTDAFQTLEQLPKDSSTVILPPQIDIIPNTRNRMNVPALAVNAKVPFAFSLGLRNAELSRVEAAPLFALSIIAKTGLSKQDALKAATLGPAELLGLQSQIGSLEVGKLANLIVLDGSPFETETSIESVYVEGGAVYEDN